MAEIKFQIVKELMVLSQGSKGWQKEVNLVSWNDRTPKFDIREWGPEHERMGKGVTLNKQELIKLQELLQNLDIDNLDLE